jgi:hypothetical protein
MSSQLPQIASDEDSNTQLGGESANCKADKNLELRAEAINDYENDALARPDSIDRVLGMASASLQRLFEFVYAAVREETLGSPSIETVRELESEIRLLIALRRQVVLDRAIRDMSQ